MNVIEVPARHAFPRGHHSVAVGLEMRAEFLVQNAFPIRFGLPGGIAEGLDIGEPVACALELVYDMTL